MVFGESIGTLCGKLGLLIPTLENVMVLSKLSKMMGLVSLSLLLSAGVVSPQQPVPPPIAGTSNASPPVQEPDADGVYKVGHGVVAPKLLHGAPPEYSNEARREEVSGICVIGMLIDTKGKPSDIKVIKPIAESVPPEKRKASEGLDVKAMDAVRQYRFQPATYQGTAVPVRVSVVVRFNIY